MTLFTDPSLGVYLLAGVACAVAGFLWFTRRTRPTRVAFALFLALLVTLAAVDALVESPREEGVRRIKLMQDAANARNWPGAFEHVSAEFKYESLSKDAFRARVSSVAEQYQAKISLAPDSDDVVYLPNDQVRLGCVAQVTLPAMQAAPLYLRLTFARDADGQYRLRAVAAYNYVQRAEGSEIKVPGL